MITGIDQPARRRWFRSRALIFITVAIAVVVGVPIAVVGFLAAKTTAEANKGAPYPTVAVREFLYYAFDPTGSSDGPLVNFVCDRMEKAVLGAVEDHRAELAAYAARWNTAYRLTIVGQHADEHRDRATVQTDIHADWTDPPRPGRTFGAVRTVLENWTFDVIREGSLTSGWKVCGFTAPTPH